MRSALTIVAALVIICSHAADAQSPSAAGKPVAPVTISLDEYRQQLVRAATAAAKFEGSPAEALSLWKSLSDRYTVTAGDRKFDVDFQPLKKAIAEYRVAAPERKKILLSSIENALAGMRAAADEFTLVLDATSARQQLQDILARREFKNARGPTLLEIWKEKIGNWILRLLGRLFRNVPTPETGYRIFVWVLIAISACALAIWLKRMAGRRQPEFTREPIPFAPSARHWRSWLADARQAAAQGNWRDAVHLAYWAAISHLEESGAWVPDCARTPREYLRLLSPGNLALPTLTGLTRTFELIWYGNRPAGAGDFQQTLEYVEQLGCR